MTRKELQVILYASTQLLKLIHDTKECLEGGCVMCEYNAICKTARLTHQLLEYQDTKLRFNGERKN